MGSTTSEHLHVSRVNGAIAVARFDRPEARNALSSDMMDALRHTLADWQADVQIRVGIIAGSDAAFAAGADLRAMRTRTMPEARATSTALLWPALASFRKVLIAAVSGPALGAGIEVALACDLIVASNTAFFAQAEINVGVIPGGGGSQRLTRLLGKQRAMELVLTGRRVSAQEAHEIGLVNRVVDVGGWYEEALELAREIAGKAPIAVELAKQAVLAADETPLSAGIAYERRAYELAMATKDRLEGIDAFFQKRSPQYSGQ
jgi:enoyl-CoA hydratase/carnithine racemase